MKHGRYVTVYNINILEEFAVPDLDHAYNFGVEACPNCGSDSTCYTGPKQGLYGWFCTNCELLWEYQVMEEYVEE